MSSARPTDMDYYDEGDRYVAPSGVEVEVHHVHSGYVWYYPVLESYDADSKPGRETVQRFARQFTEVGR